MRSDEYLPQKLTLDEAASRVGYHVFDVTPPGEGWLTEVIFAPTPYGGYIDLRGKRSDCGWFSVVQLPAGGIAALASSAVEMMAEFDLGEDSGVPALARTLANWREIGEARTWAGTDVRTAEAPSGLACVSLEKEGTELALSSIQLSLSSLEEMVSSLTPVPVSDAPPREEIHYHVRLRLPDGSEVSGSAFTTRRERDVGDVVNLPSGPDGRSHRGKGYIWRVSGVEGDGAVRTLVLDFERPHPELAAADPLSSRP